MKCPTCSSEMRPLLTSMYCPNEERHARRSFVEISPSAISGIIERRFPASRLVASALWAGLPSQKSCITPPLGANTQHLWWRLRMDVRSLLAAAHQLEMFVDSTLDAFVADSCKDVLGHNLGQVRGYREILTFDTAPHWVRDDGQIVVRPLEDDDAYEVRLRAIWEVGP